MANKFSKRGKNPGAVDSWLDSLSFYRKNVAYDETCLFRAVAEQLFYSQLYHERVRKECIAYGKKYCKEFKHYFPKKRDWYDRLKKLNLHMQICNEIEIQLICNTYKIGVKVLNANDHTVKEFCQNTTNKPKDTIILCKMNEDHYDSVYHKEHINNAGFCQSIIYNLLYEEVFQISNVSSIVNGMLHEKQTIYSVYSSEAEVSAKEECFEEDLEVDEKAMSTNLVQNSLIAPFPFKVAKALDPNMYRNIEYDTWLEVRRSMRLGDWYYGDDKLILGTRCDIDVNGIASSCYIQEILKNDQCIVYITSLAQRRTVNYTDLKPEDNAKPWPLPYRFVRKLPFQSSNELVRTDNDQSLRKRRERNRFNNTNDTQKCGLTDIQNDYQGCNLLIQEAVAEPNLTEKNLSLNITNGSDCSIDEIENWNYSNIRKSEPLCLNWSRMSTAAQPDIGISVVDKTPTISQETSRSEQFYCNYGQDSPIAMPIWYPQSYVMPSEPITLITEDQSPTISESERALQNYVYYPVDNSYGSPTILSPSISTPSPALAPYSPPINERYVCNTPMPPHVDPYSFMYPLPAHNPPLYYSYPTHPYPTVQPRSSEILTPLASPLPMYTNPHDIQYSPSIMYSSQTPSVAWFPPNVNAQGFIFPSPP